VGYVSVDGRRVWHEIDGAGPPVVLLHGGFFGASSWARQAPALVSAGFRVHRPERRGHAHTPDGPGPLSYAAMAADTIAYLVEVVAEPADLIGWSDGAVVGLLVARDRPELVKRLVVVGQHFNSSGKVAGGMIEQLDSRKAEVMAFLRQEYDRVSPDGPEHFPIVFDKMLAMVEAEPEIDLETLSAVGAPTLVMQGDRDEVTVEHSSAVVRALPDARLCVLPGTHSLPLESPDVVNSLLVSFLGGHSRLSGSS
jgi:pimeloyl-ACP methyl ester carboxylesterase